MKLKMRSVHYLPSQKNFGQLYAMESSMVMSQEDYPCGYLRDCPEEKCVCSQWG